jgi:hypothetical protein
MATLITQHPIALDDQKYIIPSNAQVGDNAGKVNFLWSHQEFHNDKFGTSITDADYSFSIISGNGDGTFTIDSATGELTIADNAHLSADKSIVVRIQLFPWYYHDTTCTILVIPEAECIFFDSSYAGGDSDGTRSKPFLKLNNYGVNTGTAGKTYLYKRGQTYTSDRNEFTNPKVGGSYPDYINVGAWGQGAVPKIDMTGSSGHWISVGTIPWGNDPIVASDVCNNFRLFDFETTQDTMADRGHILVKPAGDNMEFHRLTCAKTTYQDGLIYLPTSEPIQGNEANRNIYFCDIITNQCQNRGFKIESEGVTVRNNYAENDGTLTGTEIPCANAAHRPNVDIKYVVCKVANISVSNIGAQIRAGKQTYEWLYLKGLAFAIAVFNHDANDGLGGDYNIDSSSWFKNIIIDGALTSSYFGRHSGTTDVADGVIFQQIKLKNCVKGMQVAEGATNTKLYHIDASDCSDDSNITIFSTAGAGTVLENVTALNTGGGTRGLRLDGPGITVYNTLYSGLQGTITGSNNSTSTAEVDLLGQGIDKGHAFDIEGNPIPTSAPSIGALELAELQYTIITAATNGSVTGHGVVDSGDTVTLTPTPAPGYAFKRWEESASEVSTANPYSFTATADRTLTAVFVRVYSNTITVDPDGFGTASESPAGPHENTTEVTLTAVPASGKRFVRWSVDGFLFSTENPHSYFVSNFGYDLVAEFEDIPTYTVNLLLSPSGFGTTEEITTGPYEEGDSVQVVATPAAGKRFLRWEYFGEELTTSATYSFTMGTSNRTLLAVFETIPTYTVALSESPSGFGTTEETTTGPYEEGDSVEVVATPSAGKLFVRWEEDSVEVSTSATYSFTMGTSNRTLVAIFETEQFALTLTPTPSGSAVLTGADNYDPGTEVSLVATANEGWTFAYWMAGSEVISTDASFAYTMPGEDTTLTAFFEAVAPVVEKEDFEVTTSVTPESTGTVSGAGYYTEEDTATVIATPEADKNFLYWKKNDTIVSYDETYAFSMPSSNVLLVAYFEDSDGGPAEEMDMVRDFVQVSLTPTIPETGIIEMQGEVEFEQVYGSDSFEKITNYLNPFLHDLSKVNFYVDRAILGKMAFHRPNLGIGYATEVCQGIIHRYRLRTSLYVDGIQDGGQSLTAIRHAWMAGRPYDFPDVNICEGKAYLWLTTRPMERVIYPMEKSIFYILPLETGEYILQSTFHYKNTVVESDSRSLGIQTRYRPFSFQYFLPENWEDMDKIEIKIAGRSLKEEVITLYPKENPEFALQVLYGNSLGGFDSFCFYGKKEDYSSPSGELFEGIQQPGHDRSEGTISSFNESAFDSFILRTGYISLKEKFALRDMLLRNQIYLVDDATLKKLVIENSEYFTGKDGVYIHSADIRARLAFNTQSQYGRDPRQ